MFAGSRYLVLVLALAPFAPHALAQTPTPPPAPPLPPGSILSHPGWPQAKPADVASPEAIVAAVYDVISGPKGKVGDWNRMRSLFLPDARLIPTRVLPGSPDSANPNTDATILSINDYIARSGPRMTATGFFEHSIANRTEQYGNIVHVWSTYESRHDASDVKPFARGINSFQLLKDGNRYWIVNIFWDAERPETPIPAKYLPTHP